MAEETTAGDSEVVDNEDQDDRTCCFGKGELGSVRSWIYILVFPCTGLITWGMISSFPVLFVPFMQAFGRNRFHTAIIGSIQIGLLYMLTVIPGYLIPFFGFRTVVMTGSFIMAAGFIVSIFAVDIYFLYATMGIVASLGASFLMTANDSAPLVTFTKLRPTATMLSAVAGSAGFAIMPLTTSYFLHEYGLHGALLLLAGIILQSMVLGMFYPRDSQVKVKTQSRTGCCRAGCKVDSTEKEKIKLFLKPFKSSVFWCLAAGQIATDSLSNGCRVFLVDRAIVQGIHEHQAVNCISLWGIFSAFCKVFVLLPTINKSRRNRQIIFPVITLGWSVITLLSVTFTSYTGFLIYCILAGAFHGMNTILWYLVLADTMEKELLVFALSLQCCIAGPFVMFSVPIAGAIYDSVKSYDTPYIIFGSLGLFGAICEALIPYFQRKKRINEKSPVSLSAELCK